MIAPGVESAMVTDCGVVTMPAGAENVGVAAILTEVTARATTFRLFGSVRLCKVLPELIAKEYQ